MKISNNQIDDYINKIAKENICGCLLFGFEQSLIDYRANLIAKKIVNDLSDQFLVCDISKERFQEDNAVLMDEFMSFPMFGGRKLVILRDLGASGITALNKIFKERFATASANNQEQNFILIIAGNVEKNIALRKFVEDSPNFAAIACYEDSNHDTISFIEGEFKKSNITFSNDSASYLMELIGKNRQIITLEIDKIATYLAEEEKLTPEVISKTTALQAESSSSELINKFAESKFSEALVIAENLLKNGFEAIPLIRFLSNYLIKLYIVNTNIANGGSFENEIRAQRLFFKQEADFRKQLKLIHINQLAFYLKKLSELEIKIKTSNLSAKFLLISFLQALSKKQGMLKIKN